ncbi:MAG: discoidin domain-containing protein [Mariniphaga sp.]|nr:discoidin domain-containing protein [Mariniphaga sp.]
MKKYIRNLAFLVLCLFNNSHISAQNSSDPNQKINQFTPSKSIYFDWINRNWYGSNEKKIEANLKFFKWLHDQYGMKLDIYLMDAGDIDQGPNCAQSFGLPTYGSLETEFFKKRFPNGFDPLVKLAKSFDCRLGVWLGPDGYGKTQVEAMKRKEMLVKFCRDYHFALFKFDACCSDLSPENQRYFIETMQECRKYSPDLIILNHRITLNEEARKLTTTFLWEGRETCVDVNITNENVAPHHREGNLLRGLPPQLNRLTEDHGVCLSTGLNFWDDDLILQAFNRNLIMSPEIYGSPFLLSDNELPQLARIYNIHRLYNDILVNGMLLPEEKYGKFAVSRGDSSTRLITLRNLTWQPVQIPVQLDKSIGLAGNSDIEVLQYHPTENFLGSYKSGETVNITVLPFRSCLIKVSSKPNPEFLIKGVNYRVTKNITGKPVRVSLMGLPGEKVSFSMSENQRKFSKASLNGQNISSLLKSNSISYTFPGKKQALNYLTKMGNPQLEKLPENPFKYMETCLFATDNNALEVRELNRSGKTKYPLVQECRDQFFKDTIFSNEGIWDKLAFDGNSATSFKVRRYEYLNMKENNGAFRLDLGEIKTLDKIVFKGVPVDFNPEVVEISEDLTSWQSVQFESKNTELLVNLSGNKTFRYLRMAKSPVKVAEIEGFLQNKTVNRDLWKASNLFGMTKENDAKLCWKYEGKISGIGKKAHLSVTAPASCKDGSLYVWMVVDGKIIGAADRAPAFPYNNWEHFGNPDKNFTFYIPVNETMEGKPVQVMLLSTDGKLQAMKPEVWLTNLDYYEKAELILE